jgi:hypothetical protein
MTRHQKIASFQISYMLAMIDNLKSREKPKSATWNRLNGLEEKANQALDFYRIHRMARGDLDRAVKLFDRLDHEIACFYPTTARKRQERRRMRHNQAKVVPPVRTGRK